VEIAKLLLQYGASIHVPTLGGRSFFAQVFPAACGSFSMLGRLLQTEGEAVELLRAQLSSPKCNAWIFEMGRSAFPLHHLPFAVTSFQTLFRDTERCTKFSSAFDEEGRTAMTHLLELSEAPVSEVLQRANAVALVCPNLLFLPDARGRLPSEFILERYEAHVISFARLMIAHDKSFSFIVSEEEDRHFAASVAVALKEWRAYWRQRAASLALSRWQQIVLVTHFKAPHCANRKPEEMLQQGTSWLHDDDPLCRM
jgi:hypothetical protein